MEDFDDIDPMFKQAPTNRRVRELPQTEDFSEIAKVQQPKTKVVESNPLSKYFRVPGVSIKLPSQGYYYTDEVEFNINGEIDIFPMTAADEILLKNPDALLNGRAIEQVIMSCVPQIRSVRKLVSPDIDSILLAIKAVTFGDTTELSAKCPKCKADNKFSFNIRELLNTITLLSPPYYNKAAHDLLIFIKPYTFENQLKASIVAFEETKKIQLLTSDVDKSVIDSNPKMKKQIDESLAKISNVSFDLMVSAITHIVANYNPSSKTGDTVTNKTHIKEFLNNAPAQITREIKNNILSLNDNSITNQKFTVSCSAPKQPDENNREVKPADQLELCGHVWDVSLEFNPATFFEVGF